jgi:hypothetical protein
MRRSVCYFKAQNDQGQDLLDNYVLKTCARVGARIRETPPTANRGEPLFAAESLILWDCSVEQGHVYNALITWAKASKRHIIVSRTPLPRNVLAHQQFAPIHGEEFSNEVIGEWLDEHLPAIFDGTYTNNRSSNARAAGHYWMFENAADYFLSFRGTQSATARLWRQRFEEEYHVSVRMVPENEYSYPTECVTQQQMWEGVARLRHEIEAVRNVLIFISPDYFDSFWTSSEFLMTAWMLADRRKARLHAEQVHFVRSGDNLLLQTLREGWAELRLPAVEVSAMNRFVMAINNAGPISSAPETRVPPTGLAKLTAFVVKRYGYYLPEFMTSSFWDTVRVPCPFCKPRSRSPEDIDWKMHVALPDDSPATDYYGYFPAAQEDMESGRAICPRCGNKLTLENKRGTRTLWVPILTTEKDQDRPVIQAQKVWEVVS